MRRNCLKRGQFVFRGSLPKPAGWLVTNCLAQFSEAAVGERKEVTASRLAGMELQLDLERTADHSEAAVGEAIAGFQKEMCDILLVLGASAIADRRDVVPVAIESTGGKVLQFGMPVDPGNLTLLARLDDMWIVGLPGICALASHSWIRLDCSAFGRWPRSCRKRYSFNGCRRFVKRDPKPPNAARGSKSAVDERSSRSYKSCRDRPFGRSISPNGPQNKLLADIDGLPMIVRTVDALSVKSRIDHSCPRARS